MSKNKVQFQRGLELARVHGEVRRGVPGQRLAMKRKLMV